MAFRIYTKTGDRGETALFGGKRLPKCLDYLGRYGVHAKEVLPPLQEMRRELVKTERGREQSESVKLLDKRLAEIEASTASPTVLDLQEFIAHAPAVREQ